MSRAALLEQLQEAHSRVADGEQRIAHQKTLIHELIAKVRPASMPKNICNFSKRPRWFPFLRKLGKAPEQLGAIKFEVKVSNH